MNRRTRLATGAALTACLLAAAQPAAAQPPRARVPFEGSHAFRNILKLHKLEPLASAADLAGKPPEESVLIVFGDPDGLREVLPHIGGLRKFRRTGGAVLIASDRPDGGQLAAFGVAISGRPVVVTQRGLRAVPPLAYQDHETCPVLYGLGNLWQHPPIFQGLDRGLVTNQPSRVFVPRWVNEAGPKIPDREQLQPLVRFPDGCEVKGKGVPQNGLTLIAAPPEGNGDRVLVIAGHGVFMNGMLGLDADNFTFARNCVEWLSEKGKRKYALLVEEGRVLKSFDVPLVQLPLPPLKAISGIVRGLEDENFFNRLLLDNVPRERLLHYLFLGASGLLLFYGLHRLIRAHHRGETAAPRVAVSVEKHTGDVTPLVARRNAAALREGNCYEAARDLARLCFEGEGGEPPAAPPAVRRGGRRLRREVARLWRLAYGGTPTPVAPAEFDALLAQAERVRDALEDGALRFESTPSASRGR
jgi:hypothetical protein